MARFTYSQPKEWGVRMNGTSQYITFPDNNALDITDNITLSMWIKRASTGKVFLMSKGTNGYGMYITASDQLTLTKPNVADLLSQKGKIIDQRWHHIVMTLGGGTASIYIDGVLNNSGATGTTFAGTATNLFTGQDSAGGFLFNGSMKDVRVYNTALSGAQVAALYAKPPGASFGDANNVCWGKINEGTGTTITDSSGTANNGSITGRTTTGLTPSTMWIIDPVRKPKRAVSTEITSLLFNGTSDKVVIADNAALNFGTGDFTVEAKVFTGDLNATGIVVEKRSTVSFVGYEMFFHNTTGGVGGNDFAFDFDDNQYALTVNRMTINANQWYHVICSVTRSDQTAFKLFVNGTHDPYYNNESDYADTTSTTTNTVALEFMDRNAANFKKGGLYDVRIYNRALTDDECLSRYYTNENITSGRTGWWKLDEGIGTSVADSQGSNTGTITGATWKLNAM